MRAHMYLTSDYNYEQVIDNMSSIFPSFQVERWMDKYEKKCDANLAETCSLSLSLNDLSAMTGTSPPFAEISEMVLDYGEIPGSNLLRSKIAKMYNELGSSNVTAEHIIVGNGAIGANFFAFCGLVSSGTHAIIQSPTYQQLHSVIESLGCEVSKLGIDHGFTSLPKDIKNAIKSNTTLVVLNNPVNPTGQIIPFEVLEEVALICDTHKVTLMVDEVYWPLLHSIKTEPNAGGVVDQIKSSGNKSALSLDKGNIVVSGSMSKVFSMAGLRVGWIASNNLALREKMLSARDYTTISVSKIDDRLAAWALEHYSAILLRSVLHCKSQKEILTRFLKSQPRLELDDTYAAGGTCAFIKLNDIDSMSFATDLIEKYGVLVCPGELFDRPGYLRVGYGSCTADALRLGLIIMGRALEQYK
ncbi:hypothetical protein CANCADRAFT_75556 [Tortispora caseinolytica NRRL Y-17796]|uniref:Aminotransferase class I/classII large domain-containing protein n=1 Tax=Tortispora caseinolytica NRRL Y-17796 TaxID=767744 RepID=A0A1E4TJA9_9ASCO|nr:hypothetical protein CANCADRAFT_75556 [Tortispora caseinolytica NRRL Y-17796]